MSLFSYRWHHKSFSYRLHHKYNTEGEVLGFTFDSVGGYLSELTKDDMLYATMEQLGAGGGVTSLKRLCWQIKSFLIMHTDVPTSKAIAWLKALPDDEGFYQVSMTMHGDL